MPETYDVEVRGHTYPHKQSLMEFGLWWVPDKRAWIAWSRPKDQVEPLRDFCNKRGLNLRLRAPEHTQHEPTPTLHRGQTSLADFEGRARS